MAVNSIPAHIRLLLTLTRYRAMFLATPKHSSGAETVHRHVPVHQPEEDPGSLQQASPRRASIDGVASFQLLANGQSRHQPRLRIRTIWLVTQPQRPLIAIGSDARVRL